MDREAWHAAVHGVIESWAWLSDWAEPKLVWSWKIVKVLIAQPCPTLCDPMDCSLLGSSVHGIFQSRILEWVAIPFLRGSYWPRDWTQVACIAVRFFYHLSHRGSPVRQWQMKDEEEGKWWTSKCRRSWCTATVPVAWLMSCLISNGLSCWIWSLAAGA